MEPISNTNQEIVDSGNTKKPETTKAFKFNPFDLEFHTNPYPAYHRLRSYDPIHRHFFGSWGLTRYADVKAVLRDPRFRSDNLPQRLNDKNQYLKHQNQNLNALVRATNTWLLSLEPPDHTRLRKLVGQAFSPSVVERLRPQTQDIVDQLIGTVQKTGRMDIISDLARPVPVRVISTLLGIPEDIQDQVYQWANDLSGILDPFNSLETLVYMNQIIQKFSNCFRELIAEREKQPQSDLISSLIVARDEGDRLSNDELLTVCMLLFATGEETTVNLIGNGMLALLRHPAQMELLKQEPTMIASAVEELLRYDSPIQRIARIALEDVEIDGHKIAAGEQVILYLGAANRDPAQFPDCDRLLLNRSDNNHLSFADGIHYCLGAALARVEGQIAINTLLQRLPDLQLQTNTLEWRKNIALRGLKALPVTFRT
ncbi:cytochrome P450 [Phormidesmis priestleyi ULC007]|uniref:Cytochrome P450 n=1 Tax=Phormidesmis priestleyi ULC007 TaxID=1920490 RepID=A0A2T1DB24_9CYAN|nr:cytochrome P450 [Phormidesmis priestleyi]PSB17685.1 cytochrome P450 [Phormidesmis priestleyi ULC007]